MLQTLPHALRVPDTLQILHECETPEVLLLHDVLAANIQAMQQRAVGQGLELWPHVKTHKCLEIARMQLHAGAAGLTASKPDEALIFLKAGLGPLLLAYPVLDPRKLDRVLKAAGPTRVLCILDSPEGAASLAAAAERHDRELEVCIKIDVGLGRCGLRPTDPALPHLARTVAELAPDNSSRHGLRLVGLLSHAGQAYGAADYQGVALVAEEERRLMLQARETVCQATQRPLPSLRLSVGSTPTVLAAPSYEGIDDIRPGNYVFLDRGALRLGLASSAEVALWVLARVVSGNKAHLIIDAGAKTLALDLGAQGSGDNDFGFGLAWQLSPNAGLEPLQVVRLSEEHGFVARPAHMDVPLGALLAVLPNHACPVANLAERFLVFGAPDGTTFWSVDARAKVR
jgi:D-serine deaminase-like pyridoxal phosphate-dependent protein